MFVGASCQALYRNSISSHFEYLVRVPAAIVLSIVYGHDMESDDDWMFKEIVEGTKTIEVAGAPGAHIVDLLPFCEQRCACLPIAR